VARSGINRSNPTAFAAGAMALISWRRVLPLRDRDVTRHWGLVTRRTPPFRRDIRRDPTRRRRVRARRGGGQGVDAQLAQKVAKSYQSDR